LNPGCCFLRGLCWIWRQLC